MLTRRRHRRPELNPNAEINLVNLVDLAFVLLIIFMITAPMMQGGIDVQLPTAAAAPMTADQGVMVSIDRTGRIYIGQVRMQSEQEFIRQLPSHLNVAGKREVFIKGDEAVPYGRVLGLFSVLKRLNLADVHLVVEPETQR